VSTATTRATTPTSSTYAGSPSASVTSLTHDSVVVAGAVASRAVASRAAGGNGEASVTVARTARRISTRAAPVQWAPGRPMSSQVRATAAVSSALIGRSSASIIVVDGTGVSDVHAVEVVQPGAEEGFGQCPAVDVDE
jgi:hypothetical protein